MPLPELDNSPEQYRQSADVIERPNSQQVEEVVVDCASIETSPDGHGRLEQIAAQVGGAAGEVVSTAKESISRAKESAADVYEEVRSSARAGYSQVSQSAQDLMRVTTNSAKIAKEEYPLQSLAVLAGVGFVIGMALRIWRSYGRNA